MLNKTWILIGKKLSGEATAEELKELEHILEKDPTVKYHFGILEKTWGKNSRQEKEEQEQRWKKFEGRLLSKENPLPSLPQKTTPFKKYPYFILGSLVTAIALVMAIGFFYLPGVTKDDNKTNEITAPMGAITKIHLIDGTKVWLNAGSKLVYKKSFGASRREVSLTGEAFFDVTKDARHPFVVTTPFIRIKVLGTRFNVRAYLNDKLSEATLLSGRIDLTVLKNPEKEFVIRPMEKVLIKNEDIRTVSRNAATDDVALITLRKIRPVTHHKLPAEMQWTENVLVFDAENLEDLAKRMERRFNVSISIQSPKLLQTKFTGQFKDEAIEQALAELQSASDFHYKINDNHITLY